MADEPRLTPVPPTSLQNDVHNRLEPQTSGASYCTRAQDAAGECFGGFARLRAAIRYARQLDPAVLVLDAGDEFVGRQGCMRAAKLHTVTMCRLLQLRCNSSPPWRNTCCLPPTPAPAQHL